MGAERIVAIAFVFQTLAQLQKDLDEPMMNRIPSKDPWLKRRTIKAFALMQQTFQ